MLNPKEMKKGGFGSFIEKERERKAVREALAQADGAAAASEADGRSPAEDAARQRRADKTTTRP